MGFNALFIEPSTLPQTGYGFVQLLTLFLVYGRLVMIAADMIGDGSELLLLVPSLSAVVGSTLVPILGAVPDGALVLFSGLGSDAQNQLNVGIGALAGSTIMLLTIPWGLSVLGGRVSLDRNGKPIYSKPKDGSGQQPFSKLRKEDAWSLFRCGCTVAAPIRRATTIMLLTTVPYFIIQGAGQVYDKLPQEEVARKERGFAAAGLALCCVGFVAYLAYQYKQSRKDQVKNDRIEDIAIRRIQSGEISMAAVLVPYMLENKEYSNEELAKRAHGLVRPFFHRHDYNNNDHIEEWELQKVFADLGEPLTATQVREILQKHDRDGSGVLEFQEFLTMIVDYVRELADRKPPAAAFTFRESIMSHVRNYVGDEKVGADEDEIEDDDDDDEIPEDLQHLSYEQQQRRIKMRAAWLMTAGTILCLFFSDPIVDVLDELGSRTGIPAFYVSFVVAPLITNYTELVASYKCALRKTVKSMTVSLAIHPGASILNNTYVLGIFLALLLAKQLAWRFSAETISILIIEVLMFFMSLKKVHTLFDALIILSFFPMAIAIVYILETYAGLD